MKSIGLKCVSGVMGVALSAVCLAAPVQVKAPVDRLFIPEGYDDNDNVEIILHGEFPSSCYRIDQVNVDKDDANHSILMDADARRYEGEICAQVITPYIKPVGVGLLEAGQYTAQAKSSPLTRSEFDVSVRKTESPDDFIYAPVKTASVRWERSSGKQIINLQGVYPRTLIGCAIIDDVKVNITSGDVVIVQPILDFIDDERCDERTSDYFDEKFVMPTPFVGKGLLHVRVMNGNSLNTLLEID